MGKTFSLLQQLTSEQYKTVQESPLPKGIKYQEYMLNVKGKEETVYIPLRECGEFENSIDTILDGDALKKILRKHRGIRKTGI